MPAADPGAGGADAAPLRGPGWGVVGQQDQDLGVVGGGEAMKDTTTLAGDGGLRGARLAADGVARLAGILAGALLGHHHAGEDLPALVAGLLADHLPHHGGLRVLHHRAVGGRHRLDHIGLEQLAAVDGSGEGCDHLDGGDGESLAEGAYRQVHAGHRVQGPDRTHALPGSDRYWWALSGRRLGNIHKTSRCPAAGRSA